MQAEELALCDDDDSQEQLMDIYDEMAADQATLSVSRIDSLFLSLINADLS
jgi:hypothetical protein